MLHPSFAEAVHRDRAGEAARRGLSAATRTEARLARTPVHGSRSVRRTIGGSIVRIGQAIAAEPRHPVASP